MLLVALYWLLFESLQISNSDQKRGSIEWWDAAAYTIAANYVDDTLTYVESENMWRLSVKYWCILFVTDRNQVVPAFLKSYMSLVLWFDSHVESK